VLGYDVDPGGGRLVVNEEEADRVRTIFALFEEHRSVLLTLIEIERRGWRLKSWTRKTGQFRAGGPFALNSLRRLLTNILYTGSIRHRGKPYPGEHAAILAPGTWERVQNLITPREVFARGRLRNKHLALLSGLLYCESCSTRMVYSYSGKNDRRYPYYVCLNAQRKGWALNRFRRALSRNRSLRSSGRCSVGLLISVSGNGWIASGRLRLYNPSWSGSATTGLPVKSQSASIRRPGPRRARERPSRCQLRT